MRRRSRKPRPGTRRARPAYVYFHVWSSSGLVRIGLFFLPSFGGVWRLRSARVRVSAPRCPIPRPFESKKNLHVTLRYEPRGRGSQSCAANPTVPHAPHTTSTRPCAGIAATLASNTRAALPTPGRALALYSLAVCPRKDRKGAYSHTHSAGFLGTHAGPDKCIMLTRESRPVKLWGLCTGAAACGRGGHRRKCTRTETRRKSPEIVHFEGRAQQFSRRGQRKLCCGRR